MSILNTIFDTAIAFLKRRIAFGCIVKKSALANNTFICANTRFYYGAIDKNTYIGRNGFFFKTVIGKFSSIADMCYCGMPEHEISLLSTSPVFFAGKNKMNVNYSYIPQPKYKETRIGNDVWVGAGVKIKAGISIGDGAVIGMGSVVTHDIPPYSIAVGIPARVIRKRFSDDLVEKLIRISWWDMSDDELIEHIDKFSDVEAFVNKYLQAAGEKSE